MVLSLLFQVNTLRNKTFLFSETYRLPIGNQTALNLDINLDNLAMKSIVIVIVVVVVYAMVSCRL